MLEDDAEEVMDFGPGEEYEVYISYFLGKPDSTDDTDASRAWGGELVPIPDDPAAPKMAAFKKIYVNKLKGVYDEEFTQETIIIEEDLPEKKEEVSDEPKKEELKREYEDKNFKPGFRTETKIEYEVEATAENTVITSGCSYLFSVFSLAYTLLMIANY